MSSTTDAIKRSILTEKSAMDFYTSCATHMKNEEARKTFELLAREEREHAESFFKIYDGDDIGTFEEFMQLETDSDWLNDLEKAALPNMDVRKAMEFAMEKEQQLEKHLLAMAEKVEDADIKAVYEANAKSTHNHYVLIESEYARMMGMVHETDIDTFVRE
jgi:rubrerythrin